MADYTQSENDEIESQEHLLIRQQNYWKNYSTVYDEIREECRLDYLQDLGNVYYQHQDGARLLEIDDISEVTLDYLVGFE